MGRIQRGWEITKSSWRVLRLDKELIAMPILSGFFSMAVIASIVAIMLASQNYTLSSLADDSFEGTSLGDWEYVILIGAYLIVTFIVNFFGAAIIYGAIERFRGNDPTIRSSIAAAKRHLLSIAGFSLLTSTIGLILQAIEERVPLAGRITTWILDAAWSIASMFAVPVIVMSDKPTGPLEATRKSVNIVKKAWGESAVSQIGLGLIQILYTIGWTALMAAIIAGYAFIAPTEEYDIAFGGTLIGLFIIGMVVISVIFSALSSIAKAATYHYATTGESPEMFNKQLMREAMTAKKASKIFAQ